jgi:Zn-dependent peptidase ImmA (M78 family)
VDEPKMRDEADCDHEDLTPDGLWDDETRTIWIMQNLPTKRLRYVLAHELHHAIVDYLHHLFNEGAACP